MTTRARYLKRIVSLVGCIVPEGQRRDWCEEWHAELDAVSNVSTVDVLRGALTDALLLRVGASDEWLLDARVVAMLISRHLLAVGTAIWVGSLWFSSTVLLATLCAVVLAGNSSRAHSSEMLTLTGVGVAILAAVTCAAVAAIRVLLTSVEKPENRRRRRLLLLALLMPSLAVGLWVVRMALDSLGESFEGAKLLVWARAMSAVAGVALVVSIQRPLAESLPTHCAGKEGA